MQHLHGGCTLQTCEIRSAVRRHTLLSFTFRFANVFPKGGRLPSPSEKCSLVQPTWFAHPLVPRPSNPSLLLLLSHPTLTSAALAFCRHAVIPFVFGVFASGGVRWMSKARPCGRVPSAARSPTSSFPPGVSYTLEFYVSDFERVCVLLIVPCFPWLG